MAPNDASAKARAPSSPTSGRNAAPALTRGMLVVDILADSGQSGLTVSDIALRLGLAKSSTANLCAALEDSGMARRVDGRYTLGRKVLTLAGDYLRSSDQLTDFYARCRELPIISREAARLAILDGTDVIYLARYEGQRPIRLTAGIGDRFPASVTATGKAIFSTMEPAVIEDRFRGRALPGFTEKSHRSLPGLLADLRECAQRGWAMDNEETSLGVVCFSVPVVDVDGAPASAAVSTTLLKHRAEEVPVERIVGELQELAGTMSNPLSLHVF